MNIFIADDDQNLLAMLLPHLEYQGHSVTVVSRGADLLDRLAEKRADLVISDINMPGLGGDEIYRKVRARPEYAAVPFILWSGVEAEKGLALELRDLKLRFLKKPFSLAALRKVIEELTDLPFFGDYDPPGGKPGLKL